jgi:hypothetical protein
MTQLWQCVGRSVWTAIIGKAGKQTYIIAIAHVIQKICSFCLGRLTTLSNEKQHGSQAWFLFNG